MLLVHCQPQYSNYHGNQHPPNYCTRMSSCVYETPMYHDALPRRSPIWASRSPPYLPRLPHLHTITQEEPLHHKYYSSYNSGSPHGSGSSSPSQTTTPRPPKKNASRERMKTELHALRHQAGCLETELAYLQQLAQERLAADTGLHDEPIRNSREPCGGWRAVAERQRARRIRAEMTNRRLRATVESQMDEWRTLHTLFASKSQCLLDRIANVQGLAESKETGAGTSPSCR